MSVSPVPAYAVSGQVNDRTVSFVIDTDAAVILLQKEFWDGIKTGSEKLDVWTGQRLVGVDGTPLQVYGVTQVQFQLAGDVFTTSVLVVGKLAAEVILGLDFLELHKCTVDLAKELYFTNRETSLALCSVKKHQESGYATRIPCQQRGRNSHKETRLDNQKPVLVGTVFEPDPLLNFDTFRKVTPQLAQYSVLSRKDRASPVII